MKWKEGDLFLGAKSTVAGLGWRCLRQCLLGHIIHSLFKLKFESGGIAIVSLPPNTTPSPACIWTGFGSIIKIDKVNLVPSKNNTLHCIITRQCLCNDYIFSHIIMKCTIVIMLHSNWPQMAHISHKSLQFLWLFVSGPASWACKLCSPTGPHAPESLRLV